MVIKHSLESAVFSFDSYENNKNKNKQKQTAF